MGATSRIGGGYAAGPAGPTVGLESHTDCRFVNGKVAARVDRRAERGRATRDQRVAVATELFAARGFDGTSIEAVLEQAGVSRGSLYHHFASKEALFEAALDAVEARDRKSVV